MGEEFYCILKLVSGEEIFSVVCPSEEDGRTMLFRPDKNFERMNSSHR